MKGIKETLTSEKVICEVCCKCKIHQLPHKPSNRTEKDVLGLVHSDTCGPIQNASLGGASYFATITDDKTRYTQVTMLKRKSDVFKAFVEYKANVERITGKKIKRLRTDNAKEYASKISEFLKKEGISRELFVEYTSQQNGVAERANRTLVEMARCMMVQSRMPPSL